MHQSSDNDDEIMRCEFGLIDESSGSSIWRKVGPNCQVYAGRTGDPPSTVMILLRPVFFTEYMAASA